MPEWFLNPPVSQDYIIGVGHSASPNLYIANKFALIWALSDLSGKVEVKIHNMLKEFEKAVVDSSSVKSDNLEFSSDVSNNNLYGVTIKQRSIGIDKNGNF